MNEWVINSADFAVLRTPFLSENTIDVLQDDDGCENANEKIKKSLLKLIELSQRKEIVQAIEFASPSLAEKICELTNELTVDNLKLASSIYKYITRMSTRCTPFGAFSSVMTLPISDKTNIDISPEMRIYLRVDNSCVMEFARLAEIKSIKEKNLNLRVRKNSSLYKIGNEFRFVVKSIIEKHNDFKLDSVKFSDAINEVLNLANDWYDIKTLINSLSDIYPQAKKNQLVEFVFNLLENQLLESDLTVVISSKNSLKDLYDRAVESLVDVKIIEGIQRILLLLDSITQMGDVKLNQKLLEVKSIIADIAPEHDMNKWLHVDSFRGADEHTYGQDKIQPILKTVSNLTGFFWHPSKEISEFVTKFEKRYGDSVVPLLEALDADTGISFGQDRGGRSPLLEGLAPMVSTSVSNVEWSAFDRYLLSKVIDSISKNQKITQINSKEIEKFKSTLQKPRYKFDDSVSVHGVILQGKNQQPLFQVQNIYGPSTLMLLGRFCCGDERLLDSCRKIAQQEQASNPDVIYAEIIHIPQANIANISCRPSMRDYEIVYGPGDSSLSTDKQIKCDDLYLKIDQGRLCLFSKKLNKEVKPRLASAHNTAGLNLPVYQFLHALQGVDGVFTSMHLKPVFHGLPYLPEIRIDNLIISQRRWLITAKEIHELSKCLTIDEKITCFKNMKSDKAIVRYVALSEGDNVLEFDLESAFSILTFIHEIIKRKRTVKVVESVKGRTDKDVQCNGKVFRHEIVIPSFMKTKNKKVQTVNMNKPLLNIYETKKLSSMPGENWKYLKIYTGEASADKLLFEHIAPLANMLKKNKSIENWHFIRYYDPDFHLRVRFKLNNKFETDLINKALYKALKDLYKQGLIHSIAEDCHVPEIQRYGGPDILATCEELFYLNSVIVADFISSTFLQANKDELRWRMCLNLAWQLALGVCDSLEDMEQFYKKVAASYDNEFGSNSLTKKKLSDNYRSAMKKVAESLSPQFINSNNIFINSDIYPQYHKTLIKLKHLCRKHNRNVLQIIQSIIHMDCNRIFVLSPRVNEWIVYHYLARYSRTVIARKFVPGREVLAGFGDTGSSKKSAPVELVLS